MKRMRISLVLVIWAALLVPNGIAVERPVANTGVASWYGEEHRGKLMANGHKFDPDKLTAASWFYPLGTRLRVITRTHPQRSVVVTVTDRGPAHRYVRKGRIIDLAHAAFKRLAAPDRGLVPVMVVELAED